MGRRFTIKGTLNHLIITVADNENVETNLVYIKCFKKP